MTEIQPDHKIKHSGMFQKGVSGNPSGRPKLDIKIREVARQHTQVAIETLVEIVNDKKEKGSTRVQAACALLDRGWGRPIQSVENFNVDVTQSYTDFLAQLAEEENIIEVGMKIVDSSIDDSIDDI